MPKAKKPEEKCNTEGCNNRRIFVTKRKRLKSGKVRTYTYFRLVCSKCQTAELRRKHPCTYILNALRLGARRRGIPCSLTLEEFKEFCRETNYVELRGTAEDSLTIDRIDPNEGYHAWNMRVLSHKENSAQGVNNSKKWHLDEETDDPF